MYNYKKNLNMFLLIVFSFVLLGVNCIYAVEYNTKIKKEQKIKSQKNKKSEFLRKPSNFRKSENKNYIPGQLIVKLREVEIQEESLNDTLNNSTIHRKALERIQDLNIKYNITSIEKVFKDSDTPLFTLKNLKNKLRGLKKEDKAEREILEQGIKAQEKLISHLDERRKRAPKNIKTPDLNNTYILNTSKDTDILLMAKEYKANPDVVYAEPNYIFKVNMIPNDTYYMKKGSWGQDYDDLWGLKKIDAEHAWDTSLGDDIIVAVVDTGIDYNHNDIKSNIWINKSEVPNNSKDDDNNGYIDDVKGWDFAGKNMDSSKPDNDPMDGLGHGTHVAGTIAAVGNNNLGIIGVAPLAKVMAVKALDDDFGAGTISTLSSGIKYAARNGADVINCSWGGFGSPSTLEDAINYAVYEGCIIIAAAGNENMNVSHFSPANNINVMAIASVDHDDKKSDYSNWGFNVDVSAPGGDSEDDSIKRTYENILSLKSNQTDLYGDGTNIVDNVYYRARGTSMATPHAAGLAALIIKAYPDITNTEIKGRMIATCDALSEDYYGQMGAGRINAYKALTEKSKPFFKIQEIVDIEEIEGDGDQLLEAGEKVKLIIKLKNVWMDASAVSAALSSANPNISSIIVSSCDFGAINSNESKDNSTIPFIFQIAKTRISSDTKVEFNLLIQTDNSYTQKLSFKIGLGIKKIHSNKFENWDPYIFDNKIVWEDGLNDNSNIALYDLETDKNIQINTDNNYQKYPVIYNDKIVWISYVNDNFDVYLYDLHTQKISRLTNDIYYQYLPFIYGNSIVWMHERNKNFDIRLYDLNTNKFTDITETSNIEFEPHIYGSKIVWGEEQYTSDESYISYIYLYDIETKNKTKITNNQTYCAEPRIFRNYIIWTDFFRNDNADIYMYDIGKSKETQITNDLKDQSASSIFGSKIVWMDYRNNNNDIYLYDLDTKKETQITSDFSSQIYPSISGNRIVWMDDRYGNFDIYMTEIPIDSTLIISDDTIPSTPEVIDTGESTKSNTLLTAGWYSSDPESGIAEYQYSIGTSGGAIDILAWKSAKTNTSVTEDGLDLNMGITYYFNVKAKNGAGLWSNIGYSDGITVNIPNQNITVSLSANPNIGTSPLYVTFTAVSSYPEVSYKWDFDGDGLTDINGKKSSESYTYQYPKTYTARVKVTDIDGNTAEGTAIVTVQSPPSSNNNNTSSDKKKNCFIGSLLNKKTENLTRFRDTELISGFYGRYMINFYYYLSPKIVDFIIKKC
ncbi:MAG: S8 family serine peptidase [Candidatus Firestonebacteria bacterium]|nr:S8 family serine peptidase [Candidatus Firestonebacteria bacterium]